LKIYQNDEVEKAPPLSTRRLLEVLGSNHSGQNIIHKATKMSYIKRIEQKKRGQSGQPPVLNVLTEKGKALAESLFAIPVNKD
jgi:hypothetical protein